MDERKYHDTSAEYSLPNDQVEHKRLEEQSIAFDELMQHRVFHAPLQSPSTMLDIGCGTGALTHEMASTHPSASVYGVDLSPIPSLRPKLPNITYIQGDVRSLAGPSGSDPRLGPNTMDYIFHRLLVCGMTNWGKHVEFVMQILRPGGWAEIHDLSYEWLKDGKPIDANWRWRQEMNKGLEKKGLDPYCGRRIEGWMKEAGMVDVRVTKYKVPWGIWDADNRPETRKIGEQMVGDIVAVFGNLIPKLCGGFLSEEEVEELNREMRECLKDEVGKYWYFYVVVGRKP